MAARRKPNRRRRRGRFGFLYKLLSVLITFAAVLAGCVIFFRVNRVEVAGNHRYSAEEVIEASGVELGDNLFLVNRSRTSSSLIRRLPYVQKASMVRRLPDTIELHITEALAAAVVETEGAQWVIDSRGKLLESLGEGENELARNLPRVLGLTPTAPSAGEMMSVPVEEQTALDSLRGLMTALAARDMTGELTDFIDVRAANYIYFGYGGDLTVAVPAGGDLTWYAYALERVLEQFAQQGERVTGTLYLTYGEDRASLRTERWLPEPMDTKGRVSDGEDRTAGSDADVIVEPPSTAEG